MLLEDNWLTVFLANLARIPFRLKSGRPFETPVKALILKPGCLSQVMLTTPLLAGLSEAFPEARIDWAVGEWARPGISGNPRLNRIIDTGQVTLPGGMRADVRNLISRLRQEGYDTCFVPARSSLLSYIAWKAGIPQRIGLDIGGRGFAYIIPVKPPKEKVHTAEIYLSLASAIGIGRPSEMEFYPADADCSQVTGQLLDEVGWDSVMPLAVLYPGGATNPAAQPSDRHWPAERFALLSSRLVRKYGAHVVLVGSKNERELAGTVQGMVSTPVSNLSGRLSLGELGALCEVADLYVGNDVGPTQIAIAMGCPTVSIFGPTDPARSGPYTANGKVRVVQAAEPANPFSWEQGPSADDVLVAADKLLGLPPDHLAPIP